MSDNTLPESITSNLAIDLVWQCVRNAYCGASHVNKPHVYEPLFFLVDMSTEDKVKWIEDAIKEFNTINNDTFVTLRSMLNGNPLTICLIMVAYRKLLKQESSSDITARMILNTFMTDSKF